MNIADNIIKYHLSHVYWVFGTACGGKTTMTEYLSRKHDIVLYNSDEKFSDFAKISDKQNQPAMNKKFKDYEEYFSRPPAEYTKWLEDSVREQFGMVIADLLTMPKDKPIIVDAHCDIDNPLLISSYDRIVYLIADAKLAVDQHLEREDKKPLYDCIMGLKNPQKLLKNLNDTLTLINKRDCHKIINSGLFYIVRDENSTVEKTGEQIEKHFKL